MEKNCHHHFHHFQTFSPWLVASFRNFETPIQTTAEGLSCIIFNSIIISIACVGGVLC